MKLEQNKKNSQEPNKFYFLCVKILAWFLRKFSKVQTTYHFDRKKIEGKPAILLADHSSYNNFLNVVFDFPLDVTINGVVGACHPRDPQKGFLLEHLAVIPKKMYTSDLKASMKMMRAIKAGHRLLIFPEGMYSYCGVTHPINPVIAGFLKTLNVDVIVASTKGAYLTTPRVTKDKRKGPLSVDYYHIFTPEQLSQASTDEIYEKLMSTIEFNDFEWNAVQKNKYIGKLPNATGFEKVLYMCPHCKAEGHMYSEGNKLICEACKNTITVDETYSIYPATEKDNLPYERIDEWFYDQRRRLRKEIRENENFELNLKAKLNVLNMQNRKSMFIETGSGEITINRQGVSYKGTDNGVQEEFLLPIKEFFGSSNQQDRYMVLFKEGETIAFDVGNIRSPMIVKACGAIEELHALINPEWDKALMRVFK